ncbi:MAG: tetratricopeptide repeat protein [Balneolaceae bacterium]|nr:tetratricopeptide repeat protein [Balneolaceae bacterium]
MGIIQYTTDGELTPDTSNVLILIEIFDTYRFVEQDSAFKYASLALEIAERLNFARGILIATYSKGSMYFTQGNYQEIYDMAFTALQQADTSKYRAEQARLNQLLGISYASQGYYEPGLRYFMRAKNMFDAIGNEMGAMQNLVNIGVSYLKTQNYTKALDIFVRIDSLRGLKPATISVPVNLGFIYYEMGEYQKAEYHLKRVINFEGEKFDRRSLGLATFKLGEIHLAQKQYDQALNFFSQSIEIYEKLGNKSEKLQALNGIARTYLLTRKLKQAEDYALQVYNTALEHNALPDKQTSSETLHRIYRQQGDFQNAYKYLSLYKSYSDSMQNDEISKKIGRLEAEFDFQKKELELINEQRQQNAEHARTVSEHRTYLFITFSLLAIAVVVASLLYRNSKLRKKANRLLQEKNEEIEAQAKELHKMNELKNHLFSILAHDLRSPLSSLHGFITLNEMDSLTQKEIQKLVPELVHRFQYTSNLLNNLLHWSKSQLEGYTVEPAEFHVKKLFGESTEVLNQKAANKDLSIQNNIDEEATVYADKNMVDLVLLNLVSNAIKFTPKEGRIEVSSSQDKGYTTICVTDTGVGITEDQLATLFDTHNFHSTPGTENEMGTGLGLTLCVDFIKRNKGKFWATSEEGIGSQFYFTLPSKKP